MNIGSLVLIPLAVFSFACSDDAGETAGSGGSHSGGANNASPAGGSEDSGGDSGNGGSSVHSGGGNLGHGGSATGGSTEAGSTAVGPLGPEPVLLGTAENYVVLAESAITNVPISVITGDVGLSPAAASYITGFAPTKAGASWTSDQVIGLLFAADNDLPTPTDLTTAVADMHTAYVDAAGRSRPDYRDLSDGALGGLTLAPGLYKWSSTVTIDTNVTIAGGADDHWIFQITGDLSLAAAKVMKLSGGARAENIVWQVAGTATFDATSRAQGIVLSKTSIDLGTGASINGRLLAQTAINLKSSTVTAP